MKEPKKVKIIESKYYKQKDIVEWMIEFVEDKKQLRLVWPSSDLGVALGINGYIKPELMEKFCKDIKGKEINLVMESDIQDVPSFKDMSIEQVNELSKKLDEYPFSSSIEIIQEKDKDQ